MTWGRGVSITAKNSNVFYGRPLGRCACAARSSSSTNIRDDYFLKIEVPSVHRYAVKTHILLTEKGEVHVQYKKIDLDVLRRLKMWSLIHLLLRIDSWQILPISG